MNLNKKYDVGIINVSKNDDFRKKRYEKRKDYKIFNDIHLPYNMEDLSKKIDLWVEDDSYSDFHTDNKESYYKKILSNRWDFIVDWSINLGNNHFAITINTPNLYYNDINLSNYNNIDLDDYKEQLDEIINLINYYFPTISYIFIVGEKNKKDNLHFHLLIGIRNFIDYDYCLKNNLLNVLKMYLGGKNLQMCDYDVKIQSLRRFRDIKNWVMYLYKDMYIWKFPACLITTDYYYQNVFKDNLGDVIDQYLHLYFIFCKFEKNYNENVLIKNLDLVNFKGVILRNNSLNFGIIINLIQYYLIFNNLYLYNNYIYKKLENSLISYQLIGSVEDILYKNFQENIVSFFVIRFENYFIGFDFNYLLKNYFIKSRNIISSINDISTNKIKLDFSIIEFTDGLYFIKYNRFVKRSDFESVDKKFNLNTLSTLKYCNKKYNTVRKKEPLNWINGLLKSLNITPEDYKNCKNINKFILICIYLANIFHRNIFKKKTTLLVYGESNTRKSSLVSNPIKQFFGKENVGSIITSKNFKLQELEGKFVGILDEFRYDSSISGDFLKLLGGEGLIVEKKYSKGHINIDNIPIIILSNNLIEDKNENINKALYNRIYFVEFFNPVSQYDLKNVDFNKLIIEEEINIILYCNKIYFKSNLYKEDQNSFKKITSRINNKKFLTNIHNNIL